MKKHKIKLDISSFSYKKNGIPHNQYGDYGGFIFDCRLLPNPHFIPEISHYNGLEAPVIKYLLAQAPVSFFLDNVINIVEQAVESYLKKQYCNLQISFGCTGGKHRSVYCAQYIADYFKYNKHTEIIISHNNLNQLNLIKEFEI